MRPPNTTEVAFSDLVAEYAIKVGKDHDNDSHVPGHNHGLGPKFVFMGGCYMKGMIWTTLWGKLTYAMSDEYTPQMCEGPVVSLRLIKWKRDGRVRGFASDRTMIPQVPVGIITDIPLDALAIIHD